MTMLEDIVNTQVVSEQWVAHEDHAIVDLTSYHLVLETTYT